MSRRRLVLAAVGFAGFLTVCDQLFHVRTGTLVYHWEPQVGGQTVIVPLTFFLACLSMLDVSRRVGRGSASWWSAVGSVVVMTAAYLVSGLVDASPAYAVALLVAWAARVAWRGEGRTALVAMLVIAAGGVLGEAALSAIGEFGYVRPDLLGVPWWLFPLYLHGAIAAVDVTALLRTSPGLERSPASGLVG